MHRAQICLAENVPDLLLFLLEKHRDPLAIPYTRSQIREDRFFDHVSYEESSLLPSHPPLHGVIRENRPFIYDPQGISGP